MSTTGGDFGSDDDYRAMLEKWNLEAWDEYQAALKDLADAQFSLLQTQIAQGDLSPAMLDGGLRQRGENGEMLIVMNLGNQGRGDVKVAVISRMVANPEYTKKYGLDHVRARRDELQGKAPARMIEVPVAMIFYDARVKNETVLRTYQVKKEGEHNPDEDRLAVLQWLPLFGTSTHLSEAMFWSDKDPERAQQHAVMFVVGYAGDVMLVGGVLGNAGTKVPAKVVVPRMGRTPLTIVRAPANGAVGYGATDLSRTAQAYRLAEGLTKSGRNIVVIEYRASDGSLKTVVKSSQFTQGHAERLAAQQLNELRVQPGQVTRIYSELQPCVTPTQAAGCAAFINRTFPQAEVTWSFEYGATKASRAAGVTALKKAAGTLGQ